MEIVGEYLVGWGDCDERAIEADFMRGDNRPFLFENYDRNTHKKVQLCFICLPN